MGSWLSIQPRKFCPSVLQANQCKMSHFLATVTQGFWYFARSRSSEIQVNLRNPAKFTKTRKIPQNWIEILSNACLYNIFETHFSYRGYLLAVNLQIYLGTSSLKHANNIQKLPCIDYVAKNWALVMMLKALPLVHFWSVLLFKEQMMTPVRKTLKMLVWSAQNRSISSEICPENNHKIGRKTPAKSADFSANLSLKILRNLTFSSATYQKPCVYYGQLTAFKTRVSNDQKYMTISQAQVLTFRSHMFFELFCWPVISFWMITGSTACFSASP